MRRCTFMVAVIFLSLLSVVAAADTVRFGDILYVYPEPAEAAPTLTLSVFGEYLDPATHETRVDPLPSGAVFGVYAKGADGAFLPYPDPSDPSRPWQLAVGEGPLSVALPLTPDLYLRQEAAPEGYVADMDEYRLLSLPGEETYTNYSAGMQGVRVALSADGESGLQPIGGVVFTLDGGQQSFTIVTDAAGEAMLLDIPAGEYTLRQRSTLEGYSIDESAISVTVPENRTAQVGIVNSRNGLLTLYAYGITVDASLETRTISLARTYEVFDGNGVSQGFLGNGESMRLTASMEGRVYTLRMAGAPEDGFFLDDQVHQVVLRSGESGECRVTVNSAQGLFSLAHVSSLDGTPVSGGVFALFDERWNKVLTFEPDSEGRFMPVAPLAPGQYTLGMTYAAEGFQYTNRMESFQIVPYLTEERPIAQLVFASAPIPTSLLSPQIATNVQALPSLFSSDAQVDFSLYLLGDATLPVYDLSYEFDFPPVPGLSIEEKRADGARVRLARRVALEGAQTLGELTVSGVARYWFRYAVAEGVMEEVHVETPFTATVATFAPLSQPAAYAVTGYAVNHEGAPLAGLRVTLEDASGTLLFAETVTDPFGAYGFERTYENARVRFHAPAGYGVRMTGNNGAVLPLETRQGRVVVQGGLAGYPVTLTLGGLPPQTPDGEGRFSFTGIFEEGDRVVAEAAPGVLATVEGEEGGTLVTLFPAASVAGAGVDSDGKPVAGVQVTLAGEGGSWTTWTDGSGAYAFDGLFPGQYRLTVTCPDAYFLDGEAERGLSLAMGEHLAGEAISLILPSRVEGRVAMEGGPLEGVEVTIQPGGLTAVSDAEGRFLFEKLAVGEYTVTYELPRDVVLQNAPGAVALTRPGESLALSLEAVRPARLSGRVWDDENDDALYSLAKPGLVGAVVTLLDETGEALESVTTGRNGDFAFENLRPGTYTLGVLLPEDRMFTRAVEGAYRLIAGVDEAEATSEPLELAAGQTRDGLVCGATVACSVSGALFEDYNGDGIWDEGEPPLADTRITLWAGEREVASVLTDGEGGYRIGRLRAGEYTLSVTLPEGCVFTAQQVGVDGAVGSAMPALDERAATRDVSLRRWRPDAVVNAGAQRVGSIAARLWIDADMGGDERAGEGYPGAEVALYAVSGEAERLVSRAVTDGQGEVLFETLRPGTYMLRYQLPSEEWGFSSGAERTVSGWGYGGPLTIGREGGGLTTSAAVSRYGRIAGRVFIDGDYDGLRNEGSPAFQAKVALLDGGGNVLSEVQAASDGAYAFENLFAGGYYIRVEVPEGYVFTRNRPDAPSHNSNVPETADAFSQTALLFLPAGETLQVDAGVYQGVSISGMVWHDKANTGLYQNGNEPVAGAVVTVLREGAEYGDIVTDDSGRYGFENLPPGEYTVRVTLPQGMRFSDPLNREGRVSAILPTEDGTGTTNPFVLAMGESRTDMDAGVIYPGGIGGRAYNARDNSGMAGVDVTLMQNGMVTARTTTGEDGAYRFDAVRPGEATLRFTPPEGFLLEGVGYVAVAVPQSGAVQPADIRLLPQTIIEGYLWIDAEGSGEPAGSGEPLDRALVTLLRHDAGAKAETEEEDGEEGGSIVNVAGTGADGRFRFEGLVPGIYSVRVLPPEGMFMYGGAESERFELAMGETADFTARAYAAGFILGTVWEDVNGTGEYAGQEPVLTEVAVDLLGGDGEVVQERVTDEDGMYLFNELPPGTYTVRVTLPEGYLFDSGAESGPAVAQWDGLTGLTAPIPLEMGGAVADMNIHVALPGRVGDLVWLDSDGDGLQDTGESGLAGIAVSLWRADGESAAEPVAETITDEFGRYRFDNVPPGRYRVELDSGDDYLPTRAVEGLGEINSKLAPRAREALTTEAFVLCSNQHLLTVDGGVVPWEMAETLGWIVQSDGAVVYD